MPGAERLTPRLVTVVVPLFNGADTLPAQLAALADQTYDGPWELLVVDNGSTDGGPDLVAGWQHRSAVGRVERATERRGVSYARNAGARSAAGSLVAFCDADDVVAPRWLAALVEGAASHDVVGGPLEQHLLNPPMVVDWRGHLPQHELMRPLGYLPFAPGGNCAIWLDVFERLGGWDESYVAGSDDVDFCWRAQQAGYTIGFAPDAVLHYRFRHDLRSVWRQFGQYGETEALLYKRFRRDGARRDAVRDVLHDLARLLRQLPGACRDLTARGVWIRQVAFRTGRWRGGLRHRVFFP